jgi:hypothetical protein
MMSAATWGNLHSLSSTLTIASTPDVSSPASSATAFPAVTSGRRVPQPGGRRDLVPGDRLAFEEGLRYVNQTGGIGRQP